MTTLELINFIAQNSDSTGIVLIGKEPEGRGIMNAIQELSGGPYHEIDWRINPKAPVGVIHCLRMPRGFVLNMN